MKILDKGINKMLNWESIETTIPEMVNLIQTEILEKASEKDLRELEKGMHKTWAFLVGNGSNARYYPSSFASVRLRLRFSPYTHQIQQISLQDTENKKEYFIPTGKTSCTQLQRAVLRRIEKYNYEKTGVHHKTGTGGKFLNQKEKAAKPDTGGNNLYTAVVSVFVCIACLVLFSHTGLGDLWTNYQLSKNKPNIYKGTAISESEQEKAVATVQNGYLGEYTDITVKEILDLTILHSQQEWKSERMSSDVTIVRAKYYEEGYDELSTTIEFMVLNGECFKITNYSENMLDSANTHDLLLAMNVNYLMTYVNKNRDVLGDYQAEKALVAKFNDISASAIQYGASANYNGDRARICELFGEKALDITVTEILSESGEYDLTYYSGNEPDPNYWDEQYTDSTEPSVLETESSAVAETSTLQEEIVYLLDLAYGSTGDVIDRLGSNIVYTGGESGSYTFYHASDPDVYYGYVPHDWEHPEMQGDEMISAIWVAGDAWISPNLTADMTKADLDSVAWNTPNVQNVYVETYYSQMLEETICSYRIETSKAFITFEWYLDRGDSVESPASSIGIAPIREKTVEQTAPANNMSKEGYVIESSGGLKIRSGPSTSYEEIGRLAPLEKVVILETQSDGTRDWGRIDRGWVCMDYIIWGTYSMRSSASGYDAVFAQYRSAEACNYQEYGNYISESIQFLSQIGTDFDIYYAKIDLNQDGIQELVIGGRDVSYEESSIEKFDLFTLSNNIPTRLVEESSFGNRAHLYIYTDGTFAVTGSGGASTNSTEFYTLPAYSSFASVTHGYGTLMGEPYYHGEDGYSYPISENELYALPNASQLPEMNISWTRIS